MSLVTLPKTLVPGTYENVADVQSNFDAVRTAVNGNVNGDNLAQSTAEALGISSTNLPRRVSSSTLVTTNLTSSSYVQILRAGPVVVPSLGILHLGLIANAYIAFGSPATISIALQLNGTTIRSRFGVASGVSGGLMEVAGISMSNTGPSAAGAVLFTDTSDVGLSYLASGQGASAAGYGSVPALSPAGVFVPAVVNAGSYVVDFVAKLTAGTSAFFTGSTLLVHSEAF